MNYVSTRLQEGEQVLIWQRLANRKCAWRVDFRWRIKGSRYKVTKC